MTHLAVLPPRQQPATASLPTAPTLLRFITCGSVDDGKSTLIGRLLADTGNIPDDQIATLSVDSRRFGTQGGHIDYALLLDGLAAEREQGITIDVAHRYFSTPRRAFIVADTPGHRQYTRNMATGASRADLAVVLVDARQGLLEQTRRHTLIVSLLGVREIVLAVNKMDLVDFSEAKFAEIETQYRDFVASLGANTVNVTAIPLCARESENVTIASSRMPWYNGPTLLAHLETVDVSAETGAATSNFRFPVQLTLRPDETFRGYAGTISAGTVAVGDKIVALPNGRSSVITRIVTATGDLPQAGAGQSVTLVLADALDISRGDMIVSARAPATVSDRIEARVLWSSETPLDPARDYLLKLGTATVPVRIDRPERGLSVTTGLLVPIDALAQNAIGDVTLSLNRAIALDLYTQSRETGGFILIDRQSNETVAMGLVLSASKSSWHASIPRLPAAQEGSLRSFAKALSWRVTGSIDTFCLAYLFTGNVTVAVSISGAEVATKLVLYYVHERAWARISFGLTKNKTSGRAP